jgi:molybdate transport system ATP-binding protein
VSITSPELDVRLVRKIHAGLTLDLSIRLDREIGVLFGPSGAGKTSILRLITGLARPDEGCIRLGEEDLFDSARRVDEPLRRRRIGMIFQDDLLFPHLSVAANIAFGLNRESRDRREARLAEVSALCGVGHLLERRPAALSGGERQRVGLARALAPRPRLLLCDEPVSALDLPNRHALIDRLRAVQKSEGIPVLYVTHSPAEAIALGSKLFFLERGKIVAEGPPLDVLASARGKTFIHLEGVRNTFPARVGNHSRDHGETLLRIDGGPILRVPLLDHSPSTPVLLEVGADDILLARGPVAGLSARNLIAGVVERVVSHGAEAEVIVRTGEVAWIASVVSPAVEHLALTSGIEVHMIIKARSCHVSTLPEA